MNKLTFIKASSELGAGTRGASLGPNALEITAYENQSDVFSKGAMVDVISENELLKNVDDGIKAKRVSGVADMAERICDSVKATIDSGSFPIVLTGDHANAAGSIAGVKAAYPDKKMGIIWIDAHADLHTPFTTPSGNTHGMPLATTAGVDNLNCKRNTPTESTLKDWERWKNTGGFSPKAALEDMVFIGLRSVEDEEWHIINKHNIKVFEVAEVREIGVKSCVQQTLETLSHCDILYVSFDVDSLDPTISVGTGTPVENGFFANEAKEMISLFGEEEKLAAFEITEINPLLDTTNKMATAVLPIFEAIVETKATH